MKLNHFQGQMEGRNQKSHIMNAVLCQRQGSKESGMTASLRGEFIGGRISIKHNPETHRDTISLSLIGGYNGHGVEQEQLLFEDIFRT